DLLGIARKRGQIRRLRERRPSIEIVAQKKADRRRSNGARAASEETTPRHLARERQFIEPLALVTFHARRQDVRFPSSCWKFEATELANHFGHTAGPFEPVLLVDVLPARQKAQELGGGDGLDLLT